MINIKQRERLLTMAAIAVIVLLAGDKLVFTPLVQLWQERSARIQTLQKSLSNATVLLEREKAIREHWMEMETNALPANISTAESQVFKAVDRWVESSRISFTGLKPQWKQADEEYQTLECQADGQGNMESVARFLYELERDSMAVKAEDVQITARDTAGQLLTLSVRVSGLQLKSSKP